MLMAIGQLGIILTPGAGVVLWAFVLGFAAALAFIVVLTLPPRLAAAGDVHRMSAAIFTVQYATAFVLPLIAGSLWDLTGVAALAFAPGVAATAVMAWLAMSLRLGGTHGKIPPA
jgi:CP family cyanate transporter-like MFS transporter